MNLAYKCAEMCRLSYKDKQYIMAELERISIGFFDVTLFQKHSSQAILVEMPEHNILAFRGSDEQLDWILNFRFFHWMRHGKAVHRGFYTATECIYPQIYKKLRTMDDKPLIITGHSLGGAMALIAADLFNQDRIPFESIYTYGQPRPFKSGSSNKFHEKTKGRYWRYENNNDIVSHVPPSFFGYKHAGKLMYINVDKKIIENIGLISSMVDHTKGIFQGIFQRGIDFKEDHDINLYIKALT